MCQSSQQNFTALAGMVNVQTANTNLDGSGTLNLLLTAPAVGSEGVVVKTITIKACSSNAQGMCRFFIANNTGPAQLWKEVPVPANVQSATVAAYQTSVRASYMLAPGQLLYVTTQNAENWNFIAEAVSWLNCPCPQQPQ